MIGHRLLGTALQFSGEIDASLAHYDEALTLYDPNEHRKLTTRFNVDTKVAVLSYRSQALWLLGYSEAARADARRALYDAREIGHAATLMFALSFASVPHRMCGNYAEALAQLQEVAALANEKDTFVWKAIQKIHRGILLVLTGKALDAVQMIVPGITAFRSTGATISLPSFLSYLASAHAECSQFDDAWRCIREAMTAIEATKERWWEAEVNRVAGEIAQKSPEWDTTKAEAYFEGALLVARQQQAKSWELRAAMSMAQLWRDQGKREEARELLAPVYGWFTEGFDTRDLKEGKALLDELTA
jgi:predicted ATPase